uniref:Uncharacterized protein n=1 Tax=Plectus sambesii TaxID=2011161 RepID=A0A914WEI7_9BILA
MYDLAVIKPVSCEQYQFAVEICYPVVEQTEVRSLFQVQRRGAFNNGETVFGYAKVAELIVVLPVMDRNISDIESIDLGRCEQKHAKYNALPTSTIPFHRGLQTCQHQFATKLATSERYWLKQEKRQTSTAPKKVKEVLPAQKFRQQHSSRKPVGQSVHCWPMAEQNCIKSSLVQQ